MLRSMQASYHWGRDRSLVQVVQQIVGTPADGIVGPKTKKALDEWVRGHRGR